MARTIDEFGNESGSIVERKEKKKRELAMNDGPSTPIKFDEGMNKFMPNLGAGRTNDKKIRSKIKIPRA